MLTHTLRNFLQLKKVILVKQQHESTENVDTVNQDSNDGNTVSDMSDSMSRYASYNQ